MPSNTTGAPSRTSDFPSPVRRASPIEIPALAALLGKTLADDPLLQWIFPENSRRVRSIGRHFTRLLKAQVRNGNVTTIDGKSVALWTPLDLPQQSLWERYWERYEESFYMRWSHGRRVHQVRDCFQRMAQRHPSTPHRYLLALATEDAYQGQGLASRLLEEMFLRCDKEGHRIVLETSKQSNLAYYEKFGFAMTDELLIGEGVKTWLMVR